MAANTPQNKAIFINNDCPPVNLTNLQNIFVNRFGFDWLNTQVSHHHNVNSEGWAGIETMLKDVDFSNTRNFVCVICAHGGVDEESYIALHPDRNGSTPNEHVILPVRDIIQMMSKVAGDHITKILIVCACRGQARDKGVDNPDYQEHPKNDEDEDEERDFPKSSDAFLTDEEIPQNFLLVYQAAKGYKALESKTKGFWLLDEMTTVVMDNETRGKSKVNFLQILVKATELVAIRESKSSEPEKSGNKNTVTLYHRLCKPVYFEFQNRETLPPPGL